MMISELPSIGSARGSFHDAVHTRRELGDLELLGGLNGAGRSVQAQRKDCQRAAPA